MRSIGGDRFAVDRDRFVCHRPEGTAACRRCRRPDSLLMPSVTGPFPAYLIWISRTAVLHSTERIVRGVLCCGASKLRSRHVAQVERADEFSLSRLELADLCATSSVTIANRFKPASTRSAVTDSTWPSPERETAIGSRVPLAGTAFSSFPVIAFVLNRSRSIHDARSSMETSRHRASHRAGHGFAT